MNDPQAEHEEMLHGICLTVAITIVLIGVTLLLLRLLVDCGPK